jgi:hypothetical protein
VVILNTLDVKEDGTSNFALWLKAVKKLINY